MIEVFYDALLGNFCDFKSYYILIFSGSENLTIYLSKVFHMKLLSEALFYQKVLMHGHGMRPHFELFLQTLDNGRSFVTFSDGKLFPDLVLLDSYLHRRLFGDRIISLDVVKSWSIE